MDLDLLLLSQSLLHSTAIDLVILLHCTNNNKDGDVIYHKFYAAPYRQPKCNLTGDSFAKPLKLVIGRLPSHCLPPAQSGYGDAFQISTFENIFLSQSLYYP